jgi:hypothetical protein
MFKHNIGMLLAPNHNLVSWVRVVAREEPEEELSCLIFLLGDGEKARVTLADVPCNVGESAAIDGKGWRRSQPKINTDSGVQNIRAVAWLKNLDARC